MSTAEIKNINKKVRVIFMGTPEFALPSLSALIENGDYWEIVGVFTQPDKPVGRKQILTAPPVKTLAEANGLPVYQPDKIKNQELLIKSLAPDLIVVVAYGKIIPPAILDIPAHGCINVHASLLPKYRGAACLNAPILNGDEETGVTIMQMEAGLDTGPILRQAKIKLTGQENLSDVHDRLSKLGGEILSETLQDFLTGKITPQKQDETAASYISTLKKGDGRIAWSDSAQKIERMVRAYNPWPGTFAYYQNKIIKIIAVDSKILAGTDKKIGQIFQHEGKLAIQCGQDSLLILKLQIEGKTAINAIDFLHGNPGFIDQILS
jgi:methionyl-tRNA formyltransferase